jgi:hypothetical protein
MKKITKTIMLTLTSLCMAVCFLFSGCAMKYAGTYKYAQGDNTYELKLSMNKEYEIMNGKEQVSYGTWEMKEDAEDILILKNKGEGDGVEVNCDGERLVLDIGEGLAIGALALTLGATFVK